MKSNECHTDNLPSLFEGLKSTEKKYLINGDINVESYEDGIFLPMKIARGKKGNNVSVGGVCNSKGRFVAGMQRSINGAGIFDWGTCTEAYDFKMDDVRRDSSTVVFGGVILPHFGHLLVDCFNRLWYWEKGGKQYKWIFGIHGQDVPTYALDFLHILGMDDENILFINEPTQFERIIVPEQARYTDNGYKEEWIYPFDRMRDNVKGAGEEKIYLSRSRFEKKDIVGEDYFENFYMEKGFSVIYPETLSISEQIGFLKDAKEVVCTEGTLSHLILFAQNEISLTTLMRDTYQTVSQKHIDEIRRVKRRRIDVSYNILPTSHTGRAFLIGPTQEWKDYVSDNFGEVCSSEFSDEIIGKYVRKWCKSYSLVGFDKIKNFDAFDMLSSMYEKFFGQPLDRYKYCVTEEMVNYSGYNKLKTETLVLKAKGRRKTGVSVNESLGEIAIENVNIDQLVESFAHFHMLGTKRYCQSDLIGTNKSGKKIQAIAIFPLIENISVHYGAFLKNRGWSKECSNGEFAGTTGKGIPITSIYIYLAGELAADIVLSYRVGFDGKYSDWKNNGEPTDTIQGNGIECIEIRFEKNK